MPRHGAAIRSRSTTCATCRSGTSSRGWIPICSRSDAAAGRPGSERAVASAKSDKSAAAKRRARTAGSRPAGLPSRRARADKSSSRRRRSITRSCRCCATRTRISARSPARRGRASVHAAGRCDAADRAGDCAARVDLWQPAAGNVAVRRVGVRRGGRADRRRRPDVDRHRRRHPVAFAERSDRRSAGPAVSAVPGWRARSGGAVSRSRDVRSHWLSNTSPGTPRAGRRRLRRAASGKPDGGFRRRQAAGKSPPSP